MKRILLVLGILSAVFLFLKKDREDPSYIHHFKSKKSFYGKRFNAKVASLPPEWMVEQIQGDLAPFLKRKISMEALDKTEALTHSKKTVMRYRIVNNRAYYHKKSLEAFEPRERFEKALLTLCRLAPLPNVDFIVSSEDGTADPFYLTENEEDQAPLFGWAKLKTTPHLVLIPDYRSLSTHWFDDLRKLVEGKNFEGRRLKWADRQGIAFWRGGDTERVHRLRISELSQLFPDRLDAGFNSAKKEFKPYLKSNASYEQHLQYKYLPVLDGIMCSYPGYQWRLLSESLSLKQQSDQIQWFYGALKPYVHYVPIENDLSDLMETIEWAKNNDERAEEIAQNARAFALENLMFDDVYQYFYLALSHYATCLDKKVDRELRKTARDPHWEKLCYLR
jgi:hypothetical protein